MQGELYVCAVINLWAPMNLFYIVTIIIAYYLTKSTLTYEVPAQWKNPLRWMMISAIVLLTLNTVSLLHNGLHKILSLSMVAGMIFVIFKYPELKRGRPMVYAWLPVIILWLLDSLIAYFLPATYNSWEDYLDVAMVFAFIWAVSLWVVNNRQKKALEIEKVKSLEKEQEFKATSAMKAALEVQVNDRTAALTKQKNELQRTLNELKSAQNQLIHAEKMASLGELTAGIAHEIQNPLNFVNNFSEVSNELLDEMNEEIEKGDLEEAKAIARDIKVNLEKIAHHGKRADAIVKGMLMHSRNNAAQQSPTDLNALADEYLRLSYHGLRAKDKSFNANFKADLAADLPKANVVPQDIGRVLLNLINNAFYAVNECAKQYREAGKEGYAPMVVVASSIIKDKGIDKAKIIVADNAVGIPNAVQSKIFQPFFTTKPTGEGTGLGLSLSYDIIKTHGGELLVDNHAGKDNPAIDERTPVTNKGTVFIIILPFENTVSLPNKTAAAPNKRTKNTRLEDFKNKPK